MGKRMRSDLPKVLHRLAGKPLLGHVLDCARSLAPKRLVVVYGHGGETVPQALAAPDLAWALQAPQLGTGHAVMQAVGHLDDGAPTLILYGDVPLTRGRPRCSGCCRRRASTGSAVLTVDLADPDRLRPHRAPRRTDRTHRRAQGCRRSDAADPRSEHWHHGLPDARR